jgi:acetylornithine/succinyldiaminopimelate/putrescine aminotransferase
VALEFLDILDSLLPTIRRVGDYFRARLQDLASKYAFIREVRARGLMIGVDMSVPGKQMVLDAQARGMLINCTHDTVLRFLPPYIITEQQVDLAVEILNRIFSEQPSQ